MALKSKLSHRRHFKFFLGNGEGRGVTKIDSSKVILAPIILRVRLDSEINF